MAAARRTPYAEGSDWAAVELPYAGNALSMVLVLPAKGRLDAFEASLTGDRLSEITGGLFTHQVEIDATPASSSSSKLDLVARLEELGMVDAFTDAADFSGIDGSRNLYVGAVVHQAFVDVNEAGTEAAAASGVEIEPRSTLTTGRDPLRSSRTSSSSGTPPPGRSSSSAASRTFALIASGSRWRPGAGEEVGAVHRGHGRDRGARSGQRALAPPGWPGQRPPRPMRDQNKNRLALIHRRFGQRDAPPSPPTRTFEQRFARVREEVIQPVMEEVAAELRALGHAPEISTDPVEHEGLRCDHAIALRLGIRGVRDRLNHIALAVIRWKIDGKAEETPEVLAFHQKDRVPFDLFRYASPEDITKDIVEQLLVDSVESLFAQNAR